MAKRAVVIDIKPDGEISIDANGFEGADCEAATRELEKALGMVDQRHRKPEYHRQSRVQQQQQ